MFAEGKIDEDTVDSLRPVPLEGTSHENSLNRGQRTKRIRGESDEQDDEEAIQAQHKNQRWWSSSLFWSCL